MKASWAQPSLSRDFALLSAAIILLLLFLSAWVAWITYTVHSKRIIQELEQEASRIDRTLDREIEKAGYLLGAIGHQIAYQTEQNNQFGVRDIGQLLRTYDSRKPIYEVWSWTDVAQHVIVSSNKGVLDEPVDVSDRDYVQKSQLELWQPQIGRPIQGRVSGKWVIPIGMGIADDTGKYLGTLVASVDINVLTEQISYLIHREGISFAVMSRTLLPLTVVSENPHFVEDHFPPEMLSRLNINEHPKGVVSKGSLWQQDRIYSYYQVSNRYPYVILVGYDSSYSDNVIRSQLWPRLVQIIALACFLLLFLWIVRVRIIKPVVDLTEIATEVAQGRPYVSMKRTGPEEIEGLAKQIERISDFIAERKLVEEELRDKIARMSNET